jgi:hypothetical protein
MRRTKIRAEPKPKDVFAIQTTQGQNRQTLDRTRRFKEFPCVGKEKTYVFKTAVTMMLNRMLQ